MFKPEQSKTEHFSLLNKGSYMFYFLLSCILGLMSTAAIAQNYSKRSIMDIMTIPSDSLNAGTLNSSKVGDTVIIRGIVSISPVVDFPSDTRKIMIAGNRNHAIYLQDEKATSFAGMPIVCDTANTASNFIRLKKGQLIEVPIRITAFPANNKLGTTQGEVISSGIVEFIDDGIALPNPPSVTVSMFNQGKAVSPVYNIVGGAQYVGMKVEFSNLTVISSVKGMNQRTTIIVTDESGNELFLRDQSNHYRTDAVQLGSYTAPTEGTKIKKLRGYISSNSILGQPVPFMISPGMPDDLELDMGSAPPIITSVRSTRVNAFPSKTDIVPIAMGIKTGALPISTVKAYYSFDGKSVDSVNAQKINDTLWTASIPAPISLVNGSSLVKWHIRVNDQSGLSLKSPLGDTTGYYYRVLDRVPTIADIRERLLSNGASVYEGYAVTVTGTVTASASDIPNAAVNAPRVYVQDGVTPNSGLFIRTTSPSSIVRAFPRGSKVQISGIVRENFGVTSIDSVNANETKLLGMDGDPIQPITVNTIDFARKSQGTLPAEQWESMLVTFNDVIVTDSNADGSSNFGEFSIVDGFLYNGPTESLSKMRVETDDGSTSYGSVTSAEKSALKRGTGIKSITGIMYFSFGNYKLVPRTNPDILLGPVSVEEDMRYKTEVVPHPAQSQSRIYANIQSTIQPTLFILDSRGQQVAALEVMMDSSNRYYGIIPSGLIPGMYGFRFVGDLQSASGLFIVQ